jgi:tetratricopeptide (TPR) repeat protein
MTDMTGRHVESPPLLLTLPRALAVCALVLIAGALPSAQNRPTPAAAAVPADPASRALNAGQFDEVERLLRGATDPRAFALRARALVAQGRYGEAEKLLTPVAASQPASDAALELGLLQMQLGRRGEGGRILKLIVARLDAKTAADYLRLGLAARALGAFQDANGFFRQANRLAPDDVAVNTAWGELFLEKYDRKEAMKSFQDALRVDESHVPTILGVARVALEDNPPAARSAIERALKTNPNSVPARLLGAEIALDDRKRDEARAEIEKALKVNPNSLEARSLQAAMAFLEGKPAEFEKQVQEVLKINPAYGEVYRVTGDHAARNYRFDEAASLVRRALALDDANTQAHADLGRHLLRTGDEPGARVALERAFKDDDFDQITYNLLTLLDTLDTFETITDGDIIMRFDPKEAAVMREHALPLAKEAIATLSKRYEFKVTGPILIEMFPKHDDFAVRNVGLPGMIGALGACFGRVVTLDSPKARPPGDFNWGATLWHEIAHVVTLQMSKNRVPRWLTEGISVWEEKRARAEWGREMEVTFAHALNEGKILKLDVLNEGFSDPKMISLAYYQASLVVEHLVDTYGEPKLRDLLRAYGEGLENEDALKEAFGASMSQIQTSFDARLEKQYAGLRRALKTPEMKEKPTLDELKAIAAANPESFAVQMRLAQALHEGKDASGAIAALERAAQLIPSANGASNPHTMIATIALEQKDTARAIRALEAVMRIDHSDVESARKLAELVGPLGDAERAEDAYRRLVAIDPFDRQAAAALGRLALKRKDTEVALRSFRTVLATNPPDRAEAHVELAEAYIAAGQLAEAKKQALAAAEIAPSFERAQDLLLKILEAGAPK